MPASPYVSRINQIDAIQLDEEIYKVLKNQVKEVVKYQSSEKIDRWQPEIDAILKYFIWKFSLCQGKPTFGQQLLNLHYENITDTKSLLYLILTIGPAYVRDKLVNSRSNGNLSIIFDRVANLGKLLDFINLLIFLHRGTQPRLVEYLLGIASRSVTTHKPRSIGYSYMTRELLWHGMMELFTTGLPMINLHYLKHTIKKMFTQDEHVDLERSFPKMDSSSKCAYCGDTPILPVHAGCRHIFCYYCLKAHFTAMNEFQCSECDAYLHVARMKTYEPNSSASS